VTDGPPSNYREIVALLKQKKAEQKK